MSRSTMASNSTINDTINLPTGCYVLDFLDSDEDGMSFFANGDGNGTLRFQSIGSTAPWVKGFNPKFGSFIKHYFSVEGTVGINTYNKMQEVLVSPNPSHDVFNLSISGFENETINVGIYHTIGEVIMTESVTSNNNLIQTSFDLSDVANGVYFIRVFGDNSYTSQKIIKN